MRGNLIDTRLRVAVIGRAQMSLECLAALFGDQPDIVATAVVLERDQAWPPDVGFDVAVLEVGGATMIEVRAAVDYVRTSAPEASLAILTPSADPCWRLLAEDLDVGWLSWEATGADVVSWIRRQVLGDSSDSPVGARATAGARCPTNVAGLTRRERQVLWLLADGATSSDISAEFGVSPRTVDTHIQNLMGKLGVRSRGDALSQARRAGLLPDVAVTQRSALLGVD